LQADQAIFTSLERRGKAGYHVVARSPGVTDGEAAAVARWCPSHGGLTVDEANRAGLSFHRLAAGRFALARTVLGRPEFSGRGGRQVYSHVLLFELDTLKRVGFRPFLLYRDALALGHFVYRPEPPASLPRVRLCSYHPKRTTEAWSATARALGVPVFDSILTQLNAGQPVVLPFAGDRVALAESLVGELDPETLLATSFATSLQPSSVRPFTLHLVAPGRGGPASPAGIETQGSRADL
jgi:hypothetical protein